MLLSDRFRPVCVSDYVTELQQIYLQRQNISTSQFFCMDCQSFFHRSEYKEPEDQFLGATQWLMEHPSDYSRSIADLQSIFPTAKTCYEAGCGVGALLSQLKTAHYDVRGVDPNPLAVEHARDHFKVDATEGYFTKLEGEVDIIFAVDVLEHLERPRDFFADLIGSIEPKGGIVVRVPTVDRNRWAYLRTVGAVGARDPNDPFMDNSVHITHFSSHGLVRMAESLGAKFVRKIDQDLHVFTRPALVDDQPNIGSKAAANTFLKSLRRIGLRARAFSAHVASYPAASK